MRWRRTGPPSAVPWRRPRSAAADCRKRSAGSRMRRPSTPCSGVTARSPRASSWPARACGRRGRAVSSRTCGGARSGRRRWAGWGPTSCDARPGRRREKRPPNPCRAQFEAAPSPGSKFKVQGSRFKVRPKKGVPSHNPRRNIPQSDPNGPINSPLHARPTLLHDDGEPLERRRRMFRHAGRAALWLVLFAAIVTAIPAATPQETGSAKFEFALIGDVPYGAGDDVKLDRIIEEVNKDNKVAWVLHAGDIKNGSSDTSNELVIARFNQYQKFKPAFIYTPGDNEWTDAHRTGRNPLERLAFLRSIFYPNPGWSTGGNPMKVRTQASEAAWSEFVENQLWVQSSVVFSMIHVVGSHKIGRAHV